MNNKPWAQVLVALFVFSLCLSMGLFASGIALDAVLGRNNDAALARAVRAIVVLAVIFGTGGIYEAWKRREKKS